MSLDDLVVTYVASAEQVFAEIETSEVCINIWAEDIKQVVKYARDYLEDAKYYKDQGKLNVSLASIAYCEGLLDALRLLGLVRFEWPKRK
jgi:hypothetical protein